MKKEIKDYYESTKISFNKEFISDFEWPITWTKIFYKTYPRFPSRKLKLPNTNQNLDLERLLLRRGTIRSFSNTPIDFELLSYLMFYSVGIKPSEEDIDSAKRMYPSAGARYPIELYTISNNISCLKKGLYHYNVKDNSLETLLKGDLRDNAVEIVNSEMGRAPTLMILTGVISRGEVKYGSNAYRFALLEAGHIGQNLYLLSEKLNLGCCAIGGFNNDKLSKLLDLTEEELPIYMFAIGKK